MVIRSTNSSGVPEIAFPGTDSRLPTFNAPGSFSHLRSVASHDVLNSLTVKAYQLPTANAGLPRTDRTPRIADGAVTTAENPDRRGSNVDGEFTEPIDEQRSVVEVASAWPSPEEVALRRQAIYLVGEHWDELSRRLPLPRWLGQAFREDDSLPGEVVLVMMNRYRDGNGSLVKHLRRNPQSNPDEDKLALFGEAKRVCREVVRAAIKERDKAKLRTGFDDNASSAAGSGHSAPFGLPDDQTGWNTGTDGSGTEIRSIAAGRGEAIMGEIDVLLARGEQAWDSLCDEGILNRTDWTEDQKWTAIAMLWGFSVAQIAVIRRVKANPTGAVIGNKVATRQMMSTVRRKGKALFTSMSAAGRREHEFVGRDARLDGRGRRSTATRQQRPRR